MHVITRKALVDFWIHHPDSQEALARWHKILEKSIYRSFAELRQTFPAADQVGDYTVFNIGSNKYRLITSIHYDRGRVYIRHVLTHKEYNRGSWKR